MSTNGYKLLGNRVLAKRIEPEQKGNIVLPPRAKDQADILTAEVYAVGPGAYDAGNVWREFGGKKGDIILVHRLETSRVDIDNEDLLIMNGESIIAIEKIPKLDGHDL